MGALGHFIEAAGIPTVSISLVREHTEAMRVPRALWVPFMLGRPLGSPGHPAFQTRVLRAALSLLESDAGPVLLEDFPDDAPEVVATEAEEATWVCPVRFPPPPATGDALERAVREEITGLQPWYQLAHDRRQRTTVGVSGLEIADAVTYIAAFRTGPVPESPIAEVDSAWALKHAITDLMAYYYEAATAQPGSVDAAAVETWFWEETAAGKLFDEIRRRWLTGDDESIAYIVRMVLLPKTQKARGVARELM